MVYVEVGRKELKRDWPIEKGLTAKTNTQTGRTMNLIPRTGSTVLRRNRKGL